MKKAEDIKVAIVGLGPVGMILANKLSEAGCQLALCENIESKVAKIKADGIALENVFTSSVRFDLVVKSTDELADWDADYIIFALKSHHTLAAAKQAEKLNTEKLTVVSAQNGIDIEQLLASVFGESKTLRMVVNFAGNLSGPNSTKVTFFNAPNYLGSLNDTRQNNAIELASVLSSSGLDTEAVSSFEIVKRSWEKTILNASLSPLCGVGRLTMAEAMNDQDTVELIEQIIREGVQVAEAEKFIFPDDFIRRCMQYLKKGGDHFPSLAVDLINNRPTEIDYFNGKIVEYGRKHYVRTSLNLSFTNMVKAMTNKNILSRVPGAAGEVNKKILDKGFVTKAHPVSYYKNRNCFLGIDLGSAFTKFIVTDEEGNIIFRYLLESMGTDKQAQKNVMQVIASNFQIAHSCATGYGRKHYGNTDIIKTEINCAAAGASHYIKGEKNIIDIGGEDIKIIRCDSHNNVESFNMNDKCAAGTGSFLSEVAERANIPVGEMSGMAELSEFENELNSFCTVFAKTEIMNWIFDGMKPADIAKGIYISIANKVAKMRLVTGIPTVLIGGVIAHHPYLKNLLNIKFNKDIQVLDSPQFVVALGAALLAKNHFDLHKDDQKELNANLTK